MTAVLAAESREVLRAAVNAMSYVDDSYCGDRVVAVEEALDEVLKVVRVIEREAIHQAILNEMRDFIPQGLMFSPDDRATDAIMALIGGSR